MPIQINCPSCNRALRVPDELLGKNVKCPTCGTTFTASAEGPAPAPVAEQPPVRPPAPPDEYEEAPPETRRRPAPRREYREPHRGTLILIFGILGLVVFWPLGIAAWVMGNNDLKEIRAGRMDPEGESTTNAGRICGMISTILAIVGLVVCCVGGILYFIFVAAVVSSNPQGFQ
jgi:predicted Zn finger-like uncharacterized protein